MKKALVLSLLVLSLGVVAYGGAFSGNWETNFCFSWTDAGVVTFGPFESMLEIDYTVCDWSFGSNLYFDLEGIQELWFSAGGSLGAFSFSSILVFDPTSSEFEVWETVGQVSIAGVDFYGLFAVGPGAIGSALGMIADVGDCTFGVEVNFGAGHHVYWAYYYGVLGWYGAYDGYQFCDFAVVLQEGGLGVGADCTIAFTGLSLMVKFPIACLDVVALVDFGCDDGFQQACILVNGLDLGAGWFDVDSLAICYQTSGKTFCIDFDLTLGDAVCITPYFDIVMDQPDGFIVDGIELTALMLTYSYNGVTFKAGEIFNHGWERESEYLNAWNYCVQGDEMWYFTPCGGLTRFEGYGCAFYVQDTYPNEMFGVTIDGDSCCGGSFDVCLFNFFVAGGEAGEFGIFGWLGTYASVVLDIGTQTYIGASLTISYEQIEKFCFKIGFGW